MQGQACLQLLLLVFLDIGKLTAPSLVLGDSFDEDNYYCQRGRYWNHLQVDSEEGGPSHLCYSVFNAATFHEALGRCHGQQGHLLALSERSDTFNLLPSDHDLLWLLAENGVTNLWHGFYVRDDRMRQDQFPMDLPSERRVPSVRDIPWEDTGDAKEPAGTSDCFEIAINLTRCDQDNTFPVASGDGPFQKTTPPELYMQETPPPSIGRDQETTPPELFLQETPSPINSDNDPVTGQATPILRTRPSDTTTLFPETSTDPAAPQSNASVTRGKRASGSQRKDGEAVLGSANKEQSLERRKRTSGSQRKREDDLSGSAEKEKHSLRKRDSPAESDTLRNRLRRNVAAMDRLRSTVALSGMDRLRAGRLRRQAEGELDYGGGSFDQCEPSINVVVRSRACRDRLPFVCVKPALEKASVRLHPMESFCQPDEVGSFALPGSVRCFSWGRERVDQDTARARCVARGGARGEGGGASNSTLYTPLGHASGSFVDGLIISALLEAFGTKESGEPAYPMTWVDRRGQGQRPMCDAEAEDTLFKLASRHVSKT